jgi:hypothetical protein
MESEVRTSIDLPASMEAKQASNQDVQSLCCVCPFCPDEWPCCFNNRKALMQHHRAEKMKHNPSDWEAQMPADADLEWVHCILDVYEKKMRWVRVEVVEKERFQQLQPMSQNDELGFRLKSLFERKRNLLAIHASPPEGLFEMGGISATMRYFKDAKQLVLRIKEGTLKAR